jgi:hypothetical protein
MQDERQLYVWVNGIHTAKITQCISNCGDILNLKRTARHQVRWRDSFLLSCSDDRKIFLTFRVTSCHHHILAALLLYRETKDPDHVSVWEKWGLPRSRGQKYRYAQQKSLVKGQAAATREQKLVMWSLRLIDSVSVFFFIFRCCCRLPWTTRFFLCG